MEPMLSERACAYLARKSRGGSADTPDRIAAQFRDAGLPVFQPVVETFFHFGGYVLPMVPEGRFTIYRAKQAIRTLRLAPGAGDRSTDPATFRTPFGESEMIQAWFLMDGNGALYEDSQPIARSLAAWIEVLCQERSG